MRPYLWILLILSFVTSVAWGTVPSTTVRVSYYGNGITRTFSFPYLFENSSDFTVYLQNQSTLVGTLQTYNINYTVTGAGQTNGGSVVFTVAPPTGNNVIIIRDPSLIQSLALTDNDPLPAEALMNELDQSTFYIQRTATTSSSRIDLRNGRHDSTLERTAASVVQHIPRIRSWNKLVSKWHIFVQSVHLRRGPGPHRPNRSHRRDRRHRINRPYGCYRADRPHWINRRHGFCWSYGRDGSRLPGHKYDQPDNRDRHSSVHHTGRLGVRRWRPRPLCEQCKPY